MENKNILLKPSLLSLSLLIIMTGTAVSPALGEIKEHFNNVSPLLIKLIISLPSMAMIPFSLLSGRLSMGLNKGKIIKLGLIIYSIGGIGSSYSNSIYILLFFRLILGIGVGLIMPLSTSLIADFYQDEERTLMMGYSNAVANLGGIIATLASGYLALVNWRYVFFIYLISLLILILTTFGLPEPPIRMTSEKTIKSINKEVIIISLVTLFINIAFYSVIINIDFFIEYRDIGNSSYSGFAVSSLTFAGFISGLFLKKISSILKNYNISLSIAMMSLGFLILSRSYNIYIILFSTFLIGFGLGVVKPSFFLKVSKTTPKYSNSFSLSIVGSSILLGKFLSPFFIDGINLLLNNNKIDTTFLLMGLLLGALSLLIFISNIFSIGIFSSSYGKEV